MAKISIKTALALTAAVLATALIVGYVGESEALPSLWSGVTCAKDYMVRVVKEKVISKSTLIREYNATMSAVKQRFVEAQMNGELEGKDEQERENFYYKITVDELRKLKERISSGNVNEQNAKEVGESESEKELKDCYNPDAMVQNWSPDEADMDEDDEELLLKELDELEQMALNEDEMGWALTPEARDALKTRTKEVLVDLLNNEARQLAMAVVSAYLSGGAIAPVLVSLSGGFKYKLVDFFMNSILDVIASVMGRRINIRPAPSEAANLVPAPAA